MKSVKLFDENNTVGQSPFLPVFTEETDKYYRIVCNEQLLDEQLWRLLERQFDIQVDSCDGGWRGEYWGKLMRGACMVYSYTRDEKLYGVLTESVINILGKADDLGRIASYRLDKEFIRWDMWSRKYVMLGLEYYYDICNNKSIKKKIVTALTNQADYIVSKIGEGEEKILINKTSDTWKGVNSISIIQPFVKLCKLNNKPSYTKFIDEALRAQPIEGFNLFEYAKADEKSPFEYPINKAYEVISCFEGLLDLYSEVGGEEKLQTCVKFADKILQTDFTVIGGIGCEDELFDNATKKQVIHTEINKQETCVTVTLMKFLTALYLKTGDKRYIDAIERSFYNAYLGALNEKPDIGHLICPLFYSYSPVYNNPRWQLIGGQRSISNYALFGCCIAIGAAGLGVLRSLSAFGGKGNVKLNLFASGNYSLKTDEGDIAFNILSNYPAGGDIKVKFIKATKGLTLSLRMPDWAETVNVSRSGKALDYQMSDGYVNVFGTIASGDEIEIKFDDDIKVHYSEEVNGEVKGLYALTKGAIALAVDSFDADLDNSFPVPEAGGKITKYEYENGVCRIGEMLLKDYRITGKTFYKPHDITVWLKKK